jgi:hypothetical protein
MQPRREGGGHLHLVSRLRMSGDELPFPYVPSWRTRRTLRLLYRVRKNRYSDDRLDNRETVVRFSPGEEEFFSANRPDTPRAPDSYSKGTRSSFFGSKASRGVRVKQTTHIHLATRLRISGAASPFLHGVYSRITSPKSPSFCITTFITGLTNLLALLHQSHDCSFYISWRILAPPQL